MTEMFGEAWSPMSVPDLAPDDDDDDSFDHNRLRDQDRRDRRQNEEAGTSGCTISKSGTPVRKQAKPTHCGKRPRDMNEEEKREHDRL